MKILPLSARLVKYLAKRRLTNKYKKQTTLLSQNFHHPGLHMERLEPKNLGFYSFRIDQQFHGIFFYLPEENAIKVVDINDHYR